MKKVFFKIIAKFLITLVLYLIFRELAFLQRGYKAVGGELFIWFLPLIYYVFKSVNVFKVDN